MGFSFSKANPFRKPLKKALGKKYRQFKWGHIKKKLGLSFSAKSHSSSVGDVYGSTGSIVGKF
jgi:hypothetical protein